MTTRALVLGSLLLVAGAAQACGGAIDTTGTSSSSSGGSSGAAAQVPTGSTPTPPPPTTESPTSGPFNATANGCANFTVFAGDASGRRFLIIQANKEELGIENVGETRTINLATRSAGASTKVFIDTYDRVPSQQMYCTDSIYEPYDPVRTDAIEGMVTFTIAGVGRDGGYAVTVTLQGVVVHAATGALESIPDVTYSAVGVGWLPG
jgi:hypothetical protein